MKQKEMIQWLLTGDSIIRYLAEKYLLDQPTTHNNEGYIEQYLKLYDQATEEWGKGIYSPLWISSHYTLLELKYMEISYNHPFYQQAAEKVFDGLWFNKGKVSSRRYQDMCMSAMLLSLVTYGRFEDTRIYEIIDYILDHQMADGGWNCAWDSAHSKSLRGSFHTTISVLEALWDYEQYGYTYKMAEIRMSRLKGHDYLLRRKLMNSLSKERLAHPEFVKFHYPVRYKYDCFRALEYFAGLGHPLDAGMEPALSLVQQQLTEGPILTGKQYSGKIHFRLETTKYGRFNTFRALKIIKYYKPLFFENYQQ